MLYDPSAEIDTFSCKDAADTDTDFSESACCVPGQETSKSQFSSYFKTFASLFTVNGLCKVKLIPK